MLSTSTSSSSGYEKEGGDVEANERGEVGED